MRLNEGSSWSSTSTDDLLPCLGVVVTGRESTRWSSRSLPSYELPEELKLSAGERPRSCLESGRGTMWMLGYSEWARSLGGDVGSDLMLMEFESKGCGCVVL